MSSETNATKAPSRPWRRSSSETPPGVRKALTRTVASRAALRMFFAIFFHHLGDFFLFFFRVFVTGWQLCVDAIQNGNHPIPGGGAVYHCLRGEHNLVLLNRGFEHVAYRQMQRLAQLGREGNLKFLFDLHERQSKDSLMVHRYES